MSYINNELRRNRSEIIHLLLLPSVPKLMPELQNHLSALKTASLTYPDRLAFRIAHKASDADTVASWERISFQQFYQDVENVDLGAIGDELAAELGADWGAPPALPPQDQSVTRKAAYMRTNLSASSPMDVDDPFVAQGMDFDGGDFMFGNFGQSDDATTVPRGAGSVATSARKRV